MQRHLLVHAWPLRRSGAWITFLEMLRDRWHHFDGGRKVFAMCSSPDAVSPQEFRDLLPEDAEVRVFANDKDRREVVSFQWLLSQVIELDGAAMYCHAKGVTHDPTFEGVHWWRDMMVHVMLDYPQLVDAALGHRAYSIAGPFKRPRMKFDSLNGGTFVPWHYSGTFFWVRLDDLRRRAWHEIHQHSHGAETWPCLHFRWEESACLFDQRHDVPYALRYWQLMCKPDYVRWASSIESMGVKCEAKSFPRWLSKLREGIKLGNSQDLDLYFHYVLQYLPRQKPWTKNTATDNLTSVA